MTNTPPAPPSVADLVDSMTVEDSVSVLAGADSWRTVRSRAWAFRRSRSPTARPAHEVAAAHRRKRTQRSRSASRWIDVEHGSLATVGELLAREVRDRVQRRARADAESDEARLER